MNRTVRLSEMGQSVQVRLLAAFAAVVVAVGFGMGTAWAESNPDAEAKTEADMKSYKQQIPGTEVSFEMIPIRGGVFTMGSPDSEPGRGDEEGPQVKVPVEPFWMGKYEVTWDEYDIWSFGLDTQRRKLLSLKETDRDKLADAVTKPTKPYTDMTFGMGHDGYPAICMTQLAAKTYCRWLSAKTGHYYRLPTSAEWEYACRAGTKTAYSFGDDSAKLEDHGWFFDNSEDKYHEVGKKKANAWGLHDMHGNVWELVQDQYIADHFAKFADGKEHSVYEVLAIPTEEYPHVARGGSWDDDPEKCRSAAQIASTPDWKSQDPQIPQSIWYFTDAWHVGFRIIRPLTVPSDEIIKKYKLNADDVVNEDE